MRVLKNKREIQNYEKLRVIGLHCYTWVFFSVTCVFPLSYKHFTHVGMLQSRYKQCKAEWLLSTWSDYVQYFASLLFCHLNINSEKGKGGVRVKIPRDRLTMCRWIGSHFQLFSIELPEWGYTFLRFQAQVNYGK